MASWTSVLAFLIFISSSMLFANDSLNDVKAANTCVQKYIDNISKKKRSKKEVAKFQEVINLFLILDHAENTLRQIAPDHEEWWKSTSFSRWPFLYLLAVYHSGVLCEKKCYSLKKITAKYPKLIEQVKVQALIKDFKEAIKQEDIRKEKELKKAQDKANNAIRIELKSDLKKNGVQIYTLYYNKKKTKPNADKNIVSDDEFCTVCLSPYKKPGFENDMATAKKFTLGCAHSFCRSCVREHIKLAISEKKERINCLNMGCNKDLLIIGKNTLPFRREYIYELNKNIIDYQISYNRKFYIPCSNPRCAFVFSSKEAFDDEGEIKSDTCRFCGTQTCLKCRDSFLENHICSGTRAKQKAEDRKIREKRVFMDCPYCATWHEKIEGSCSFIKCSFCHRDFDFATGGPWDENNAARHRKVSNANGFHNASVVDVKALTKDPADYIDGKDKW